MKAGFILFLAMLATSCALMPPRRQYMKEVKNQVIPKELLNSEWVLETFDNNISDCDYKMSFLEKGQLTIKINDELFHGDNLWYVVKDSVIEFHTRPMDKIVWTQFNCTIEPDDFARCLAGDLRVVVEDDKLSFDDCDKKKFVFRRM